AEDASRLVTELRSLFPEAEQNIVEGVVLSSNCEKDDCVYRLLALESDEGHPFTGLAFDELFRVKHAGLRTPLLRSASKGSTPLSAAKHRNSNGHSPSTWNEDRCTPSCDYCYFRGSLRDVEIHASACHSKELRELEQWKKDVTATRVRQRLKVSDGASTAWGLDILTLVLPVLEDRTTYANRVVVLKSLEVLIHMIRPSATLYLFGSSATGLAVHSSDTDVAIDVHSVLQKSPEDLVSPTTETQVEHLGQLHSLWANTPALPWGEPSVSNNFDQEIGLRKVLRTRVPILGNQPYPSSLGLTAPVDVVSRRLLVYKAKQGAAGCYAEIEAEAKASGVKVPSVSAVPNDASCAYAVCESEVEAMKLLTRGHRFRISNPVAPPLVFTSQWDVSCQLYGIRNSNLLRRYLSAPELRIGGAAVKIWSKKVRINDPRIGLLSSYSVTLLYVYYLIQTNRVPFIDPESIRWEDCTPCPPFTPPPPVARPAERNELGKKVGKVFVGFLQFYLQTFDWENSVVSLTSPAVVSKRDVDWTEEHAISVDRGHSVRYHLCVEDP
ncbi:RET1 protein, partial [Diplonema papillatum]